LEDYNFLNLLATAHSGERCTCSPLSRRILQPFGSLEKSSPVASSSDLQAQAQTLQAQAQTLRCLYPSLQFQLALAVLSMSWFSKSAICRICLSLRASLLAPFPCCGAWQALQQRQAAHQTGCYARFYVLVEKVRCRYHLRKSTGNAWQRREACLFQ